MKKIKKLLTSPVEADNEIALLLWERKKVYFRLLLILEWVLSFPLFLLTMINFSVNLGRKKGRWMSISELKLYLTRRDMQYLGVEMFHTKEGVMDVLMSPIGYIYLWVSKSRRK